MVDPFELPCPACKFPVDRSLIRRPAFHCPRCGEVIEFDTRSSIPISFLSIPISALIAYYFLGLHGFGLIFCTALLWVPVAVTLAALNGWIFPKLIRTKSPYDGLFPHVTPPSEAPKGDRTKPSG